MKFHARRAAAVLLAASLSFPIAAFASERPQNREREKTGSIVRVIKKIQKVFGIRTNDDLPLPPVPPPKP